MKKLLLLVFLFLVTWQTKAQRSIDTDWIDSIAVRLDSLIKENHVTQNIYIRVKYNWGFHNDRYVVDTVNKNLLKVIHREAVTEKLPVHKKRKDTTKLYKTVTDTLNTSYYFYQNRLKKVKQEQMLQGNILEFYFNETESINKANAEHGGGFSYTDKSRTEFFMRQASKFITYYKIFYK